MHTETNVIVSAIEKESMTFYVQRKTDEKLIQNLNLKIERKVNHLLAPSKIEEGKNIYIFTGVEMGSSNFGALHYICTKFGV